MYFGCYAARKECFYLIHMSGEHLSDIARQTKSMGKHNYVTGMPINRDEIEQTAVAPMSSLLPREDQLGDSESVWYHLKSGH